MAFSVLHIFFGSYFVFAEKLPVKNYSSANGLANDEINQIVPDSRGFLWFCTAEGLSRFDGYQFKNYTQEEGLPHRNINHILETEDGVYLIATSNGLAVFDPNGKAYRWNIITGKLEQRSNEPPLFKTYYPNPDPSENASRRIFSLARDGNGKIFAGTAGGLFQVEIKNDGLKFQKVEFPDWQGKRINFNYLFTDSKGDLWIASSYRIYHLSKGGKIETINNVGGNNIFEDREGRIWIDSGGDNVGIRVYQVKPHITLVNTFTKQDGLAINSFSNAVAQTEEGRIFVSSEAKLFEFLPGYKKKFRRLDNNVGTAATDKNGNIWFVIPGKGAARYSPKSFSTFDKQDGIPDETITSIFGDKSGEIFFTVGRKKLTRATGGKFETVVPNGFKGRSWITSFLDFRSKTGEWWIPSEEGLYRYPPVSNFKELEKTPPKKIYTTSDGLFAETIHAIFEDSRGDIWIGAGDDNNSLLRREKTTEKIYRYTIADGLPSGSGAVTFGEDSAGNLWIGFFFGQLVRFKDGKFRAFTAADGFVESSVTDILKDKKGRIWFSTQSRGLFRVDDPNDESPRFKSFSTAEGLSSNQTLCMTEDGFGRIYAGTGRGINRIEGETLRVKIYTQADGLPGDRISQCYKNTDGSLWFASNNSLIQFTPQAESNVQPPPVFIDGITINGNERNVSELGETEIKNIELNSDEKRIQVSFFALSFNAGETLRYQYKFEGQDWSVPNEQRRVNLNLSAGNYKFFVRAINSDGVASEIPAVFTFKIQPPIWQRWWFIVLAFLIVGGAIFALDRYRVSKTRQVETALTKSKESEVRFRTLADTASDAILTIDVESNIIFVNQAIEKVFGYSSDEIIGQKMTILMPERMREGHEAGLRRYLETKRRNVNWESVSLPGLHKEGHEIPLEISFGEFEREGKRYFTGIARDVSERKRAETELQKAREEKFRELERVRTRIATDLHDDIGSSLTQIAVLSEVARGQANLVQAENLSTPLDRIKTVSRELVTVMSDIVWAINPQKDFLHDLVQRMRRFASDVFTGRGIKFEFHAPEIEDKFQLGANIRREVFAIYKEAVNNSIKYSECSKAFIEFEIDETWLKLRIEDDGKGFDVKEILSEDFKPEIGGNGLVNMKRRAKDLGGVCEITSETGKGTKIFLKIPLHHNQNGFDSPPE